MDGGKKVNLPGNLSVLGRILCGAGSRSEQGSMWALIQQLVSDGDPDLALHISSQPSCWDR